MGPFLAPDQPGFGVPGVVEATALATQTALATNPEATLLTADQASARNSVSISAIFNGESARTYTFTLHAMGLQHPQELACSPCRTQRGERLEHSVDRCVGCATN